MNRNSLSDSAKSTVRITAFVAAGMAERFSELTRRIGVSGTALLARTLSSELDYLAERPALNERFASASRLFATELERRRVNITLDSALVDRMNRLCREKHIQRDWFIETYIRFLVEGVEGVCEAPLGRVAKILEEPRYEFEESRSRGSDKEQALYDFEEESYTIVPSVPKDNPYARLSGTGLPPELVADWESPDTRGGALSAEEARIRTLARWLLLAGDDEDLTMKQAIARARASLAVAEADENPRETLGPVDREQEAK